MSRRSDADLSDLLDELSGTLDRLQTELDDEGGRTDRQGRDRASGRRRERTHPSIPRPGRFLQFTEEYTIPTLIAFLEANVRALELLRGLLRLLDGGDVSERRVESVGRRTLGQVEDLLGDVQGALEGEPSNPEARDLLEEARSLREEINDRVAGGAVRRRVPDAGRTGRTARGERRRDRTDREGRRHARNAPVTIDVSDDDRDDSDHARREVEDRTGEPTRHDELDVDSELDSLKRQVRGDDDESRRDGDEDGE